jgi:PAS domain S-box-containing protein
MQSHTVRKQISRKRAKPADERKPKRRSLPNDAWMAAIIDSSEDAIISKTMDAVIRSWNRGAEQLYGYTAEEVIGKPISIIAPPDRPDEIPGIMERLKRGEHIEHFETERVAKDGRRIPVELSISPVKDDRGNIIGAAKIARDISHRKRSEADQRFLTKANELLADSLDYRTTLQRVAKLAVPEFADWCAVHIIRSSGSVEQITLAHKDPAKLNLGYEMQEKYPPPLNSATGIRNVLRTGQSEMMSEISDELLAAAAQDDEHLRLMRQVGIKSYMIVPLVARGHILGTLSFVAGESDRRFTGQDLAFAQVLAGRAATAIDNARLHAQVEELNEDLEQRVVDRTLDLAAANRRLEEEIEERRLAEEALAEQKDLYDTLLKAQSDIGDGVALTDGVRFVYANEALAQIYGYSVDELLGLPSMFDIIAPEEHSRLAERLRARQDGRSPGERGETVVLHKDGRRIDVEYAVKVLRVDGRNLLFSIIRDNGERKRTLEKIQASEEKFKGLLESAPDAMVIVDGLGKIRIVNSQTEKLFGYPRQQLYGKSIETLIPERFRGIHLKHRSDYFRNPQARAMGAGLELYGQRKDGREFPVDISLGLLNTPEGILITAAIRDITERKRAQETLQEQATLLDLAQDAIIVRNMSGGIVFWSRGAEQMYGWTRVQAMGKSTHDLLQTQFPVSREALDASLLRVGQWNGQLVHFRSDGTGIVVASRQIVQRDEQGHPVAILEINSDVTERQRAQSELQVSYTQLRALTSRLQTVREEERSRIARELHDELGQALTALKFDLASLTDRLPRRNEMLRAEAQEMSDEIDATIKTVRRISTELRPGMLDDLGLAAAIEWQVQEFAGRTGIACEVNLPDQDRLPSREQATAIFRIFQETLTNVARHAEATQVKVNLEMADGEIRLRVRDNGRGFDAAETVNGHSLGLLGMRERAELLGGTFQVESAIGQGTVVAVVMPVQLAALAE